MSCKDFHDLSGLSLCHPLPCFWPHIRCTLGRFWNTQGNLQPRGLCTWGSQCLEHPLPGSALRRHPHTSQASVYVLLLQTSFNDQSSQSCPHLLFSITECNLLPVLIPLSQFINILCRCLLLSCLVQLPSKYEIHDGRNCFFILGYIFSTKDMNE